MPEHIQAAVYEVREAGKTIKSVVVQADDIARRMFESNQGGTALPGLPTPEEWRRAIRQELGGDDVEFLVGGPPPVGEPVDTGGFYTPTGLMQLISRENKMAFDLLVRQLRSPMGVVPFVGAGLSAPFGFPQWAKFLTDASEFHREPGKVLELIAKGDYIEAASVLWQDSPDRFQMRVATAFGTDVSPEQTRAGAVGLLPVLGPGPVITTNFDHVLETAFRAAGLPFDNIIAGPQPDNLIGAMHRNEHVLIKMHGDATDRSARVFTGREYGAQYDEVSGDQPATISQLASILFTNRPLLFLGSSLDRDRTLLVLRDIKKGLPGLNHYAILGASFGVNRHRKRRFELDEYGVSPLWFYPGDFGRITSLLQELIQEASTRVVWTPARPGPPPARRAAGPPGLGTAEPAPVFEDYDPSKISDEVATALKRVARRIVSGRLVFFLGAGVHLNEALAARGFYQALASDCDLQEDTAPTSRSTWLMSRVGARRGATRNKNWTRRVCRPAPFFGFWFSSPNCFGRAASQARSRSINSGFSLRTTTRCWRECSRRTANRSTCSTTRRTGPTRGAFFTAALGRDSRHRAAAKRSATRQRSRDRQTRWRFGRR